jgi:hypothetical protein
VAELDVPNLALMRHKVKYLSLLALALIADFMPEPKLVYLHLTGVRMVQTLCGGATDAARKGRPLFIIEKRAGWLLYLRRRPV